MADARMISDQTKRPLWQTCLLTALGLAMAQAAYHWATAGTYGSAGGLVDTDAYMRLVRVRDWVSGGGWYPEPVARVADGTFFLHWTRPLDVLLAGGAWVLAPVAGEDALLVAGQWLSPLLAQATLLVLMVGFARWLAPQRLLEVSLVFLFQPMLANYFIYGRPDHHSLQALAFAGLLVLMLRLMERPDARVAFAAGAVAGFGVWISVEGFVPLAWAWGALAVLWIAGWQPAGRLGEALATGAAAVVALAVMLEHPPEAWLTGEADRVSWPHLVLIVLAGLAWTLVVRRLSTPRPTARLLFLAVGGMIVAILMAVLWSPLFLGPRAASSPELIELWWPRVGETQPINLITRQGWADVIFYLGAPLAGLGYVLWRRRRDDDDARRRGLLLALGLVGFIALAMWQVRWALYASLLACLPYGLLAGDVIRAIDRRVSGDEGETLRILATAGLFSWWLLAGLLLNQRASDEESRRAYGSLPALTTYLRDDPAFAEPGRLAAPVDLGPQLLWETPHAVLAVPYHRPAAGIYPLWQLFSSEDPEAAYALARARGAAWILVSRQPGQQAFYRSPGGGPSLYDRLVEGESPAWLERVDLPRDVGSAYRLYRVR